MSRRCTETQNGRQSIISDRDTRSQLPWNTHGKYGGWGGENGVLPINPVQRTPIIFIHGNKRDASDWSKHRSHFKELGYTENELWAITFKERTPTHDEMAEQLSDFVYNVIHHTRAEDVILVAHSLGVTGVRHWLHHQPDRANDIAGFIGIAGANHGSVYAKLCCRFFFAFGKYRICPYIRSDYDRKDNHPLQELNENEASHDFPYYTIRGKYDKLFQDTESPKLNGAVENALLSTDHDGARESDEAINLLETWVEEITTQKHASMQSKQQISQPPQIQ